MFFRSLETPEQAHLASALVFELSKVETLKVRVRTVSHLRNIDDSLARRVADGLALPALPDPAPTATPARDMPPAPEVRDRTQQAYPAGSLHRHSVRRRLRRPHHCQPEQGSQESRCRREAGRAQSRWRHAERWRDAGGGWATGRHAIGCVRCGGRGAERRASKALSKESAALEFVSQAWAHLKAIASDAGGQALLKAARVGNDAGIVEAEDAKAFLAAPPPVGA